MTTRTALCALVALAAAGARAEIKDRIAGVVNGQPITLSEVEEMLGPDLARLRAQPPSAQRDRQIADLLRRGAEQLVDIKLVETEAASLGLQITEDEMQRSIEQLARQNGMDLAQFKEAVAQQGLDFESVRESVRRTQLTAELLRYKVKPRRVTDEEVQAAYANMTQEGETEVRARHIYIAAPEGAKPAQLEAAKAKAEGALRRVRAGETFALVAREMSDGQTAREGGDLGYFKRGLMLPAIERAAFSLEPGQVSELIKTSTGYHLVKVEDRRKLPSKPLAEVQEEIRNRLMNESILKEREHYVATLRKTAQIDMKL